MFSRLENLNAEAGVTHVLSRGEQYIFSGTDRILIYLNKSHPAERFSFTYVYPRMCQFLGICPVIVNVSTKYCTEFDNELIARRLNVIFHAKYYLHAAHKVMSQLASAILSGGSSLTVEFLGARVPEVIATDGFTRNMRNGWQQTEGRRLFASMQVEVVAGSRTQR